GLERRGRRIVATTLVLGMAAMILSRALGRQFPGLAPALGVAGAVVQLGAIVAFAVLAVERLLHGTGRTARWLRRRFVDRADDREQEGSSASEAVAPRGLEVSASAGAIALSPADSIALSSADAAEPSSTRDAPAIARTGDQAVALPRRTFLEAAAATAAVTLGGGSAFYGAVYGRHDYAI